MDTEFGRRVLTPIIMLVGLVVSIALIAFSVSRILLAVPELVATFTALLLAGYLLVVAIVVGKRRSISSRALGGGMAIGLIALLGAGIVSAQAGMRELHGEEAVEVEEAAEPVGEIPDDALLWVAVDIDYAEAVDQASAGEQVIAIDNRGNLPHNVVLVGTGFRVDADAGEQAAAVVNLNPGTYEYICDIPGHASSMNGTLEVE